MWPTPMRLREVPRVRVAGLVAADIAVCVIANVRTLPRRCQVSQNAAKGLLTALYFDRKPCTLDPPTVSTYACAGGAEVDRLL